MMKGIVKCILICFALSSCQKAVLPSNDISLKKDMSFEGLCHGVSKTMLNPDLSVSWTQADMISIFSLTDLSFNEKFVNTKVSGASAIFSGHVLSGKNYIAVYPYSSHTTVSSDYINTSIPREQHAIPNSFDSAANISIAETDNDILYFKNTCALVSFTLPDVVDRHIVKVVFSGRDNESVSGNVKIPRKTSSVCAEPEPGAFSHVVLTGNYEPGTTYYLSVIPAVLSKGISLTLYDKDGDVFELLGSNPATLHSGKILSLGTLELPVQNKEIQLPGYDIVEAETDIIRPGLSLSNIKYQSNSGKKLNTFLYEIDLSNDNLTLSQTTAYGLPIGSNVQPVRDQILFADNQDFRILGGVNADFFDGSQPRGVFCHDGKILKGFSKGESSWMSLSFFYLTRSKTAGVARPEEFDSIYSNSGILEALGGRAFLVVNGEVQNNTSKPDPRTCIGVSKDGKTVSILVADGRNPGYSDGMTLMDAGIFLKEAGAFNAINIDGGGSSSFVLRETTANQGKNFLLLNRPSDGRERPVPSALVILDTERKSIINGEHSSFMTDSPYIWE